MLDAVVEELLLEHGDRAVRSSRCSRWLLALVVPWLCVAACMRAGRHRRARRAASRLLLAMLARADRARHRDARQCRSAAARGAAPGRRGAGVRARARPRARVEAGQVNGLATASPLPCMLDIRPTSGSCSPPAEDPMAESAPSTNPFPTPSSTTLEGFLASDAVPQDCMDLEMLDGFLDGDRQRAGDDPAVRMAAAGVERRRPHRERRRSPTTSRRSRSWR